jgi:hypothetical protein
LDGGTTHTKHVGMHTALTTLVGLCVPVQAAEDFKRDDLADMDQMLLKAPHNGYLCRMVAACASTEAVLVGRGGTADDLPCTDGLRRTHVYDDTGGAMHDEHVREADFADDPEVRVW